MKIYFAGSIRGGRGDGELYEALIAHLAERGEVLTEHVGGSSLEVKGEQNLTDAEIYARDLAWLREADVVIAEVSTPSLGVGFELATALKLGKRILCLYRPEPGKRLSAMIAGCPELKVAEYQTLEEASTAIDQFIIQVK